MEEFWKRFDAIAAQLSQKAPEVWAKLVAVVQLQSIAQLVTGFVCLGLAVLFTMATVKCCNKYKETEDYGYKGKESPMGWTILGWGATIGGALNALYALFTLTNQWVWIGVFNPEARFVWRIWDKLT